MADINSGTSDSDPTDPFNVLDHIQGFKGEIDRLSADLPSSPSNRPAEAAKAKPHQPDAAVMFDTSG